MVKKYAQPLVMFFSPVPTHPTNRGNRRRMVQLAREFRLRGFSVGLLYGRNIRQPKNASQFWDEMIELNVSIPWTHRFRTHRFDNLYPAGLGELVSAVATRPDVAGVVWNYIFHDKALEYLPSSKWKVLDTHDSFSNRRELLGLENRRDYFFSCERDEEARYINRSDVCVAICDRDASTFRTLGVESQIVTIPFVPQTQPIPFLSVHLGRQTFGTVMSPNAVNLAGLVTLLEAVSAYYSEKPPFDLIVAGDIARLLLLFRPSLFFRAQSFSWVTFTGQVRSMETFYRSIDAAIVPVKSATGASVKFAEALSFGVPVLATAAGSRGTSPTHPLHRLPDIESLCVAMGDIQREDLVSLALENNNLLTNLSEQVRSGMDVLLASV